MKSENLFRFHSAPDPRHLGFVTTSAKFVTTFCYDLHANNLSVLPTLLRRYDL